MKQYTRDKRLAILKETKTQDAAGEEVINWVSHGTYWGHFEQLSGREMFLAKQVVANNQFRAVLMKTAATAAITEQMRVSYGSKVYDINAAIDMEGRGLFIELMCTEVV